MACMRLKPFIRARALVFSDERVINSNRRRAGCFYIDSSSSSTVSVVAWYLGASIFQKTTDSAKV